MSHPSVAVLFPGQGSQSVGMLAELAEQHPEINATFGEASDSLGYDLWALAQDGPEEKIRQTEFTQPLMYTSGMALWAVWQKQVEMPAAVLAGHSLGEFCALTAASVMTFQDGIKLVNARAQFMASAVAEGEGGMAAVIGMDDADLVAVCESITGERVVEAVNFNSPGQIAISGHLDAVESACQVAKEKGARKAMMLPVSVPNHSSLMRSAGEQLAALIDQLSLKDPVVPVMQNTHAQVPADLQELVNSLKQHVYSPVLWTQSYQRLLADFEPATVVELGPGKVLAGLGKRIERSKAVLNADSPETLASAVDAVAAAANDTAS